MKAEEMFKELGYKKEAKGNEIAYFNEIGIRTIIIFYLDENIYEIQSYDFDRLETCVDMSLHKAINQQLKELGWL